MKKNDLVIVYEDPITRERLEGQAKLIKKIQDLSDGYESWSLEFTDELGDHYTRLVHPECLVK